MSSDVHAGKLHQLTPEQASLVRHHLQEVLSSPAFRGSQRCRAFLEYVVDHALTGNSEELHERFIGAKVFDRPINYETSIDAIVRVKANEVRKRLAQYYLEGRTDTPVRIELHAGSYLPAFHWKEQSDEGGAEQLRVLEPTGIEQDSSVGDIPAPLLTASEEPLPKPSGWLRREWLIAGLGGLTLLVIAAAVRVQWRFSPSELETFWGPALQGKRSIVIGLGQTDAFWVPRKVADAASKDSRGISIAPGQLLRLSDEIVSEGSLRATLYVTQFLDAHHKSSQVRWSREILFTELQDQSVILIGAFNNPWALKISQSLRFVFQRDDSGPSPAWLVKDQSSPARIWRLGEGYPHPITHDYAIVSRLLDRGRKRVVLMVAGINHFGTQAAGEFVTDPASWNELARRAPADWKTKNLQVVLETQVVDKRPLEPKVLATHFW